MLVREGSKMTPPAFHQHPQLSFTRVHSFPPAERSGDEGAAEANPAAPAAPKPDVKLRGAALAAAIFSSGKIPPSHPQPPPRSHSEVPSIFSDKSSAVRLGSGAEETYKRPHCPRQRKCSGAANVDMAVREAQRIGGGASEVMLDAKLGGRRRRWVISRERSRLGSARKPQGGRERVGPSACCRVRK
ncbi:hypothetical protein ACRRTK_004019 [Alexandromys fortis]